MYFYIFTGPCAAGKNTIATLFARAVDKGVHIDVDRLRAMVVQPHKAPWEGKEGKAQQRLAVVNGCLLAQRFIREGYSVILSDLLSDSTARLYKKLLQEYPFKIIRLMPSFSEVKKRDNARGQRLKEDEFNMLYKQQEQLMLYDVTINNTHMKPEEVVSQLL